MLLKFSHTVFIFVENMLSEWPFPAKLGYPIFPFGPQHGRGGGLVSQQEGQLRIFFRIFQNQRVSSLYYKKVFSPHLALCILIILILSVVNYFVEWMEWNVVHRSNKLDPAVVHMAVQENGRKRTKCTFIRIHFKINIA